MATNPQALTLQRISKTEAARAFVACAGLDPQGTETPESAARAGECFELSGQPGRAVLSLQFNGGGAWILAAAGGGDFMAGKGLPVLEGYARARGCASIGFQTMRPGLVRIAQRAGYVKAAIGSGYRLEKKL